MAEPTIDVIDQVKSQLQEASAKKLTTGTVRKIASRNFKYIKDLNIDHVLTLCEELLKERTWGLGVVAYDWAFRMKSQYNEETFYIFENWLKKYVTGWGDCDDFCTHAFGELLCQNNHLFSNIIKWTDHPDFWVRRAAAVILIYPIKKDKLGEIDPFIIVNKLFYDEHHLVQKGYGWMLKVLSTIHPKAVYQFLMNHKESMPRTSFRYAMEKLEKEKRLILMEK